MKKGKTGQKNVAELNNNKHFNNDEEKKKLDVCTTKFRHRNINNDDFFFFIQSIFKFCYNRNKILDKPTSDKSVKYCKVIH